jgi:hypothetical protein
MRQGVEQMAAPLTWGVMNMHNIIWLYQLDKLVVAEHWINFKDTRMVARAVGYIDRSFQEVIEIRLYTDNFNRDAGFPLSHSW